MADHETPMFFDQCRKFIVLLKRVTCFCYNKYIETGAPTHRTIGSQNRNRLNIKRNVYVFWANETHNGENPTRVTHLSASFIILTDVRIAVFSYLCKVFPRREANREGDDDGLAFANMMKGRTKFCPNCCRLIGTIDLCCGYFQIICNMFTNEHGPHALTLIRQTPWWSVTH